MNTQSKRIPSLSAEIGSRFRIALFLLPCLAWMIADVSGQTNTTVNLGTQARNPDFSSMPVTKPVSVGTSLPGTCVVGQLFFNSSTQPGSNLYSCSSTNTWNPVGPGLALPLSVANGGNGTSTPSLIAGANVTVTGSWPNQTIAGSVSPIGVGPSLPSNCTVGQLFFNNAAAAGSNLFGCTAINSWTVEGGATLASPLPVAKGGTGTATPNLIAGTNVTISGSWPNQTVNAASSGNATSIQGSPVAVTAPINNQTLVYNTSAAAYTPTSVYTLQNGLGTTTSGTSNLQVNISMGTRTVTTTSDSIIGSDCGGLITYNNAAAVAVAVGQPALSGNFAAGCPVTVRNNGAGLVTITSSNSTIGGAVSQAVNQNRACLLVSDGTNWQLGNCN